MYKIFLDTETTGFGPEDRIIQVACRQWDGDKMTGLTINNLYNPLVPISISAMSVHHITEEMVLNKPTFRSTTDFNTIKGMVESTENVMIAHNAPFDVGVLENEGIKPANVIDTLKLIRHSDPMMQMEKHNLQYLRYYLKLDQALPKEMVINAHDAMSDVIILELLFWHIYEKAMNSGKFKDEKEILTYMIKRSKDPAIIGKFNFGKHIGKTVAEVASTDMSYIDWLLKQKMEEAAKGERDEDWLHTLDLAKKGLLKS